MESSLLSFVVQARHIAHFEQDFPTLNADPARQALSPDLGLRRQSRCVSAVQFGTVSSIPAGRFQASRRGRRDDLITS